VKLKTGIYLGKYLAGIYLGKYLAGIYLGVFTFSVGMTSFLSPDHWHQSTEGDLSRAVQGTSVFGIVE